MITFGESTRIYVVGITGENSNLDEEQEIQNTKEIENQSQIHKKTLKSEYLKLLGNLNVAGPEKAPKKMHSQKDIEGISWGMIDEEEIYAWNEEEEVKLDSELLRKLPDLSAKDLEKIDNYEKKLRKLENLEHELSIVLKKESEHFGLTENDRTKKEQLQSKINEIFTQVEIMEDNLRFTLFDEVKKKSKKIT